MGEMCIPAVPPPTISEECFLRLLCDQKTAGTGQTNLTMREEEEQKKVAEMVEKNEKKTKIDLTSQVVHLSSAIKLARGDSLHIVNGTLVGNGHSIFSMGTDRGYDNGPPALVLEGSTLLHTLVSEDKRAIGAAVFVMGKARVEIKDCIVDSAGGFGVWIKHGGRVLVERTKFIRAGRSVVACFNDANAIVTDSLLSNAAVHGVCVRGDAKVVMSRCRLERCGTRAAFVYQRGALTLQDCHISSTRNPNTPAVQAESIAESDNAKLVLRGCDVVDNEGPALVINGFVKHEIEDNQFGGEVEINPDVTSATVPRPWTELEQELASK